MAVKKAKAKSSAKKSSPKKASPAKSAPPDQPLLPFPKLELPKRWELLLQSAELAGADPSQFVERVDSAAERVDRLLQRVRTGGGGLFEVLYGLSGSGKTTFLNTLPKFFERVKVYPFGRERPLTQLSTAIAESYIPGENTNRVILIERRDTPLAPDIAASEEMLIELLETFREAHGKVLVLWPITVEKTAKAIAAKAWEVGRDSLVEVSSRGFYHFHGVPIERYYPLADATSRTLTGDGLEAFAVTRDVANKLLPGCATISDFFAAVDTYSDEQREKTWSVLKEKVRARLWTLLPGDDVNALRATVLALTQGTQSRLDIDRIGEFIDRPDNDTIYVKEWRQRRAALAQLLRAIDVRLIEVPPNVALAAVRSFGDPTIKAALKQQSAILEQSKKTMRGSRLYKTILAEADIDTTKFAGYRETKPETEEEYRRVQKFASRQDKLLNKALGSLIDACIKEDAPNLKVVTERRDIQGSSLQPDIRIDLGQSGIICLEPTWRTTGVGVPPEIPPSQNTLVEAYIQKYVLDKAWQYVKDLGL